jgi:hypothetical protein
MSSEEKMEMLTNFYKTVDKLWTKYKDSWTCASCKIRDIIIIVLILLIIFV